MTLLTLLYNLLFAPFRAVYDAALHLRDGLRRILEFFGLVRLKDVDERVPPFWQSALISLTSRSIRKKVRMHESNEIWKRFKMQSLLKRKTDEAKSFKEIDQTRTLSVSRGEVVNHLFQCNQKARQQTGQSQPK